MTESLEARLGQGAPHGPGDSGLIVCRIEDDAAVEAFAVAFGAEVGLVAEGEGEDAGGGRGHRSEVERRARLANFFGSDAGSHAQFLEADGALVLAVEGNLFVLGGRQMQDFKGQQFEGAEKFGAAIEQQRGIGTGEVDEDLVLLPIGWRWRIDYDAVFEMESAVGDDGLEEFVDAVGGGEFVHRKLLAISS